jgi:ribosomal protein S18 acetylase RimI-like enzyme
VSNLTTNRDVWGSRRDDDRGRDVVAIRKANKDEVHDSLRLILGSASELASDEQVVDFLRFAMYRGIDVSDIWLASRRGAIVWAVLPVTSPGRTMVLFSPPHVAPTLQDTVVPELIARALAEAAERGVHLAQALIDPADVSVISLYQRMGFERLAELLYLSREIRRADQPQLPIACHFENYSPQTHGLFARTIVATYQNSMDCPGLNGRRDIEDVLAGHKAVGTFDPKMWFVLSEGEQPLGVVLLNRSPHTEAIELVYLGLIASARGQGIADLLMRQALWTAVQANGRQLTLAVDSRNTPALLLYQRHGMKTNCSRVAMLKDLRSMPISALPRGSLKMSS